MYCLDTKPCAPLLLVSHKYSNVESGHSNLKLQVELGSGSSKLDFSVPLPLSVSGLEGHSSEHSSERLACPEQEEGEWLLFGAIDWQIVGDLHWDWLFWKGDWRPQTSKDLWLNLHRAWAIWKVQSNWIYDLGQLHRDFSPQCWEVGSIPLLEDLQVSPPVAHTQIYFFGRAHLSCSECLHPSKLAPLRKTLQVSGLLKVQFWQIACPSVLKELNLWIYT